MLRHKISLSQSRNDKSPGLESDFQWAMLVLGNWERRRIPTNDLHSTQAIWCIVILTKSRMMRWTRIDSHRLARMSIESVRRRPLRGLPAAMIDVIDVIYSVDVR